MKTKSFVTGCVSTLLLASVFFACTPVQGPDPKHNKDNSMAVQIYFRDGLLDADVVREAEERLAKSIPYKVIPSSETTDSKLVLKIIVDSIKKDPIEDWSYGKLWWARTAGYCIQTIGPAWFVGVAIAPVVATFATNAEYKNINNIKEKFGSLPLYFNTFVTLGDEEIIFDDNMSDKYELLLNKRVYNFGGKFSKIEMSVIANAMQSEYKDTDINKVSFDIWLNTVSYYLNHYQDFQQEATDS